MYILKFVCVLILPMFGGSSRVSERRSLEELRELVRETDTRRQSTRKKNPVIDPNFVGTKRQKIEPGTGNQNQKEKRTMSQKGKQTKFQKRNRWNAKTAASDSDDSSSSEHSSERSSTGPRYQSTREVRLSFSLPLESGGRFDNVDYRESSDDEYDRPDIPFADPESLDAANFLMNVFSNANYGSEAEFDSKTQDNAMQVTPSGTSSSGISTVGADRSSPSKLSALVDLVSALPFDESDPLVSEFQSKERARIQGNGIHKEREESQIDTHMEPVQASKATLVHVVSPSSQSEADETMDLAMKKWWWVSKIRGGPVALRQRYQFDLNWDSYAGSDLGFDTSFRDKLMQAGQQGGRRIRSIRYFLIRHSQYRAVKKGKNILTEKGIKQAEATGAYMAKLLKGKASACLISGLTRAELTAQYILKGIVCDLPLLTNRGLNEGRPIHPSLDNSSPDTDEAWNEGEEPDMKDYIRYEETFRELFFVPRPDVIATDKIGDSVSQEAPTEVDLDVVIVGHSNVLRYFLLRAQQHEPSDWHYINLKHGSVSTIRIFSNGRVNVDGTGEASHIDVEFQTFDSDGSTVSL